VLIASLRLLFDTQRGRHVNSTLIILFGALPLLPTHCTGCRVIVSPDHIHGQITLIMTPLDDRSAHLPEASTYKTHNIRKRRGSSFFMSSPQSRRNTIQLTLCGFLPLPFKKCKVGHDLVQHCLHRIYLFHTVLYSAIISPLTSLYNGPAMFSWGKVISTSRSNTQASTLPSRMPLTRTIHCRAPVRQSTLHA